MKTQRLNINIGPETAAVLKALDETKNHSYTESVRRAVALLAYIEQKEREGWSFEMTKKGELGRVVTIL